MPAELEHACCCCLAVSTAHAAQESVPPVYVITYVDVLADAASKAAALGIDVFAQQGRPSGFAIAEIWRDSAAFPPHTNHFTVVESWLDSAALQAHQKKITAQTYREALAPMLGALYDERSSPEVELKARFGAAR